jgi:hypothetical protein
LRYFVAGVGPTGEKAVPIYRAPVDDALFLWTDVLKAARYDNLSGFANATPDVLQAVLGEAAKLCGSPRRRSHAWPRAPSWGACAKLAAGRFFAERMLPATALHLSRIRLGAANLMELPAEAF